MQDEVNEKTMALCIKGGKISAQILKAALTKLLAEIEAGTAYYDPVDVREESRASRACSRAAHSLPISLSRIVTSSRLTGSPGSMALIIV